MLPPQVRVVVRDWLSANHVLLKGGDANVLVDTGYVRHVPLTLALLRSADALGDAPLARIVNTHCHSDHMGGNAAVARAYQCPITVPEGEAPLIGRWDTQALLLDYAGQEAERFGVDSVIRAGETHAWGDLDWLAVATPGHDMGALCFYNAEYRILISGDALWENGFGFVMPPDIDPQALPATRATLDLIAALDIRTVIPGHGPVFHDAGPALDRAYKRLAGYEADPSRMAAYALKVVLMFSLLDRRSFALDELPAYVERVGIYRDFNARFFHLTPAQLAHFLVGELLRAGAVRRENGLLLPSIAAAG